MTTSAFQYRGSGLGCLNISLRCLLKPELPAIIVWSAVSCSAQSCSTRSRSKSVWLHRLPRIRDHTDVEMAERYLHVYSEREALLYWLRHLIGPIPTPRFGNTSTMRATRRRYQWPKASAFLGGHRDRRRRDRWSPRHRPSLRPARPTLVIGVGPWEASRRYAAKARS